jgi:hypothetical protein
MEQKITQSLAGLRALIDELYAKVAKIASGGGGGDGVTAVTGTSPIIITGTAARPNITLGAAAPTATFQAFNAAGGPATTQSFATAAPVVVGPSTRLTWTTTLTVAAGAGTTVAGEQIQAFATLDGANLLGQDVEVEMSVTHITGGIAITATQGGLVVGSSHTPGIKMTNVTTPSHTFVMQDGQLTGYT